MPAITITTIKQKHTISPIVAPSSIFFFVTKKSRATKGEACTSSFYFVFYCLFFLNYEHSKNSGSDVLVNAPVFGRDERVLYCVEPLQMPPKKNLDGTIFVRFFFWL
jgi:hypothetical protein